MAAIALTSRLWQWLEQSTLSPRGQVDVVKTSSELQARFHALSGALNEFASAAVGLGVEKGDHFSVQDVLSAHEAARDAAEGQVRPVLSRPPPSRGADSVRA